jgi:signal transduction histidine kinase
LEVSKIIAQSTDLLPAMEKITDFIRPFFIFDNLVLYNCNELDASLEAVYAKSAGRGRSREADIAWGENIATHVILTGRYQYQHPANTTSDDRLKLAHILALPQSLGKKTIGVTVFIRYGGPRFSRNEIKVAELLCNQMVWLLERSNMQKRAEELDAQHAAIQLQEDFVNTISHELQNPLGFIKGYTTTLMRQDAKFDPDMQKEFLQIIDNETDHLSELISNLLDSARIQSGHFEVEHHPMRIDALIKEVIKKFHSRNPNARISFPKDIHLDAIKADSNRLAQVLDNILNNAVRYAPGSDIRISLDQDDQWITISIQDFGPGIADQYIPLIFERFFRTPDSRLVCHGTGLGLYICKQIINAHEGKLEVASKVGKGSTFKIRLPRTIKKTYEGDSTAE